MNKQPTFGGFGSSSGFGGFKSSSTTTNDTAAKESTTTTPSTTSTSVPSFGSFAKATTSPFATAAAAGNALALPHSPATSSASTDLDTNNKESELNESDNESSNDTPTAFGESARVKVPGIKQQTEGIVFLL